MTPEQKNEEFGRKFWERFFYFRQIEAEETVGKGVFAYSNEAFALLRDIELCYASKAYYACIILAQSIMEAHLKQVEGMRGGAAQLFKDAGIQAETEWLRNLRNAIVHGSPHEQVTYTVFPEDEQTLEEYCIRAFRLMHELPIRMEKLRK